MYVIKRSGKKEEVKIDKITARISKLCYGLSPLVEPVVVTLKVVQGLYDGVHTTILDNLAAETAAAMTTKHPDYAKLAARIAVSNLHKKTKKSFSETVKDLYKYIDPKTDEPAGMISEELYQVVKKHGDVLDSAIIYDRDYAFDYFGFKTLERSYLLKINGKVAERPQHTIMRVAVGIHGEDIAAAIETYNLMSEKWFTHATPTLFNAGTPRPQLSSCFLVQMQEDSIEGIYETLKQTALISQSAGGIGLSIHNIRATGSYIKGTNGVSNGIVPMLRVFNDTARYVDQCFHPDTILYTKNGIKKIGDMGLGDELITHDGSFNKIKRLLRTEYKGDMIELSIKQSIEPVRVTPQHPFYVLKEQQKMINFDVIRNRLDKGYATPEWIEAKDLTENDFIAFPISNFVQDNEYLSLDDCRFYGMMVGDGHVSKDGKQAHITMNKETDDVTFVKRYLYECGIHWTESVSEEEKKMRLTWSAHLGFKFSRTMLYDNNDEKIIDAAMLHLPKDKTLQIIKGIIESDGTITKRENYEIAIDMTSRNVIESVRFMLMRFGILTSGYVRDRVGNVSSYKNITTRKISYCIRLPKVADITNLFDLPEGDYVSYFKHGNYIYSRVDKISMTQYEGLVVDFEVEPNHSYTTHAGVAHNGGGKRKGAFAIYLEPWHADIFDFLDLRKNHGKEELRARDLFYALWVPDLFMKRVKEDSTWSLFCPHEAPHLYECHGAEFEALYEKYEREGKQRKTIPARELWNKILESQVETGTPYILYKDHANGKSNQKNLGTIRSSNLCTEIIEYTAHDEVAVCFTKDTQILTKNGIKNIVDCHNEEVLVYFEDDANFNRNERFIKATLLPQGKKEVYEVSIQGSKNIKATANHPFLVRTERGHGRDKANRNKYEWKKLSEIQIGDDLFSPKTKALFHHNINENIDNEYLTAGWMLGDGWQVKDVNNRITFGVCFGEQETKALETVVSQVNSWHQSVALTKGGYNNSCPAVYQDKNNVYQWATSKKEFIALMQDKFGFEITTAKGKKIYDKIADAAPNQIASFLSGLFSADGCVTFSHDKPCINLSSASEKLLHDVQAHLRCFGIHAKVRFGEVNTRKGRYQGTLSILGEENLIAFMTSIGFKLSPQKEEKFNEIFTDTSFNFAVEGKDYFKVQKIEFLGEEDVYDLNVPDAHHFIADGVVVHNCNLASLALPKFISNGKFDHEKLAEVTKVATKNLNKIIDVNYYPVPEARNSNMRHRPIGLGVQGLADVFVMLRMPFDSEDARKLNKEIFETIYFAALTASKDLAKELGHYETYPGSPASKGILQYDMWGVEPSLRWDWYTLKAEILKYGLRNSLLVAPMPTASTSQILGNNECFEPFTSNIYSRRTLSGEFAVVNKYLLHDLIELGLWDDKMKDRLISANGSVQNIPEIPQDLKELYKTAWEISGRTIIDMAADRGAFICQSQSMNIFMENPTQSKLTSMHFYAWQKGLKTGIYYLRTKAATDAIKFTVNQETIKEAAHKQTVLANAQTQFVQEPEENYEAKTCSIDNPDCEACSA